MTVAQKLYKKKVIPSIVPPTILINEKEEKLYAEIHYSIKDTVDTNYTLLKTPK